MVPLCLTRPAQSGEMYVSNIILQVTLNDKTDYFIMTENVLNDLVSRYYCIIHVEQKLLVNDLLKVKKANAFSLCHLFTDYHEDTFLIHSCLIS